MKSMSNLILFETAEPTPVDEAVGWRRAILKSSDPILRHAMPILSFAELGGEAKVLGTCFKILPGLALTARHVAAAWLTKYTGTALESYPDLPNGSEVSLNLKAIELSADSGAGRTWTVRSMYTSSHTDAALLTLTPDFGDFGPATSTSMNALLPKEGDELLAVG